MGTGVEDAATAGGRKRAGRAELSPEKVLAKAIEVIDSDGLEAFSMRHLAKGLGVTPMALYWHYPKRHDLVRAVVAEVLAGVVPATATHWEEWLRDYMHRFRAAITRHPNVAPLIGGQLISNVSGNLDMIEALLTRLQEAGVPDHKMVQAYNSVIGGMVGFVSQEFALVPSSSDDGWDGRMKEVIGGIDAERHPHLHAMRSRMENRSFILRWENGATRPMDDSFDTFTEVMIAGIRALTV
ncbi:TetR/AcrR family transcriptional regulator [Pseudooceanicola nanhaiensis]|uniref:TetR/AcrR family transcriptional regulator n=1 Tax=Pseudooceanicola nanhaiensis TaxID=375761 RepID=UPI001CD5926E|nr:TetR/AcrR family transcriptional regulator C-terminal domain-containing protein [Pseudooceanicola nanhaiensis]MCA0922360.1 TetR/AcrR family transcriptional regulator C-terminal domain-containing protein [Pseudooceanicola nanhaiensis]